MKVIELIRKFIEAIRHVRSGGRTTVRAARTRAARPPKKCPACHQPVAHSTDYRDHLH